MENLIFTCPIYSLNWNEMINKLNGLKNAEKKFNVLKEFGKKFTLVPCCWSKLLEYSKHYGKPLSEEDFIQLYPRKCRSDKNIDWSDYRSIQSQLTKRFGSNKSKIAAETFSFPHNFLHCLLEDYKTYSDAPISAAMLYDYQKQTNLCKRMSENRENVELWLECLKEIENKEAVMANLEMLLGTTNNWSNMKLWTCYISHLKKHNMKEVLEVYRKYTRLFISDKNAVEDYRNLIEKYSLLNESTTKYWIDTVRFELDFGKLDVAYSLTEKYVKVVMKNSNSIIFNDQKNKRQTVSTFLNRMKKLKKTIKPKSIVPKCDKIYFGNSQSQTTCFQLTVIRYILKNANGLILRKLFASCKFFFSLKKTPICYKFLIYGKEPVKTKFCDETLYLNENDVNFGGLENLHIYELFYCNRLNNANLLSTSIIPSLYYCSAKNISIKCQNITVEDFEFLFSNKCSWASLIDVKVYENQVLVDDKKILHLSKSKANLEYFEFTNDKHVICFGTCNFICEYWDLENPHLETVYLEEKYCSWTNLRLAAYSKNLKSVHLEKTIIKEIGKVFAIDDVKNLFRDTVAFTYNTDF